MNRVAPCLLVLVSILSVREPDSVAAERPNVLFIAIDDLNDWVGCLGGHPNALTPNIDRLAAHGVLFTNAHCQAPICGPSRASLFTGLLPSTSGIYAQISDKQIPDASEIAGKATLLPNYFENHGYKTLACGKLFHNGDAARVFDDYGGHASFGPKPERRFKYDPAWFPEKIGGTQTDWGAFPETDQEMPDYQIAAYGVKQLQAEQVEPFFLAVGFMRPHVPWYCPKKWFEMHPLAGIKLPPYLENDLDDVPELSRRVNELPAMPTTQWAIRQNEWKNIVQSYLACTTFVDAQVGKVLDALEKSDYADNTIVVLWSDHGYHVGEKNRFAKQALWDRANRVPLIVAEPGQSGGRVCSRPVGLIDLYPTLLEMCDLPANKMNEGRSIVGLLNDPSSPWPTPTITTYGRNNHAIQTERYRLYRYEDGSMELYDHREDPNEWHNVANDPAMRGVVQRLSSSFPKRNAAPSKLNKYPTNEYFLAK
jgi:arylsulfatase A-like enzyme